eukprot:1142821-Rhodomonas_salina.1
MLLRMCYAPSSTEIGYGTTRLDYAPGDHAPIYLQLRHTRALPTNSVGPYPPDRGCRAKHHGCHVALYRSHWMQGISYAATVRSIRYELTRVLRDAWYRRTVVWYESATRCPVLTYRMLIPTCVSKNVCAPKAPLGTALVPP